MQPFVPETVNKNSYFLSQPHQPFFVFGILWAIVSMVIFILSHKGVLTLSVAENAFHLYSLAFIVFVQFFHGFLFTTFPRFCTSPIIPTEVYTRLVWIYQVAATAYFIGAMGSAWIAVAAMGILLFAHGIAVYTLWWVYRMGRAALKNDPQWILVAHAIGLAVHLVWWLDVLLNLFGLAGIWMSVFTPMTVNLFLIFLTFSVAQRMIPFFSHSSVEKSPHFVTVVFVGLVLKTVMAITGIALGDAAVSIALGGYLLYEIVRWKLHPFQAPAILWILHLSLFWLPVGLTASGAFSIWERLYGIDLFFGGVHLLVLGFLTTILIGFGTRVTLGHSGQPPHADRLTVLLFFWTQAVVAARFGVSLASAFDLQAEWLFDAAGGGWILLFVLWSGRYGKTLMFGKNNG